MVVYILGKIRDLLGDKSKTRKVCHHPASAGANWVSAQGHGAPTSPCCVGPSCMQGYAPIRLADEDFYDRRVFSRIKAGLVP